MYGIQAHLKLLLDPAFVLERAEQREPLCTGGQSGVTESNDNYRFTYLLGEACFESIQNCVGLDVVLFISVPRQMLGILR